jgi:hypothetical protein
LSANSPEYGSFWNPATEPDSGNSNPSNLAEIWPILPESGLSDSAEAVRPLSESGQSHAQDLDEIGQNRTQLQNSYETSRNLAEGDDMTKQTVQKSLLQKREEVEVSIDNVKSLHI